jgi:ABC-2 type transport system ATP-binding protein
MLATLLPITSGNATINGFDVASEQADVRRSIGMVFQDPTLDDELTAYENMDFHGRMYGMPKAERKEKIKELLELVELAERQDQRVDKFSGGMRRRLEIARGILHNPKVLFLDEPTLGLDPQTKNHLWEYIENLTNEQKVTIILTTHYMDEANRLSDTVAIIDEGQFVALDTPAELKKEVGGNIIQIVSGEAEEIQNKLSGRLKIKRVKRNQNSLEIHADNPHKALSEITSMLVKEELSFASAGLFTPTLEDVFLHFTGKTLRDKEESGSDRKLRQRYRN